MKRILPMFLILSLIIQSSFISYANQNSQNKSFTDIKGHWAEEVIKRHHKKGILKGYPDGTFRPNDQMKRSELIRLINKYFGLKEESEENFIDVSEKEWYSNETAKAKYYGYLQDMLARPEELATREDVVNMVSLIVDLEEQKSKGENSEFKDLQDIDKKTEIRIERFSDLGYINGYEDKTFKPKNIINRAEIMTMAENILGYMVTSQEDIYNMPTDVERITIINPNIIIENKEIKGDLYISPGVNGKVTIKNTKIKGQIDVSGGTIEKPIILDDVSVKKIAITKVKAIPSLKILGRSNVGELKIKSETKMEISGKTNVDEIKIQAKTALKLDKGTKVEKLTIEGITKIETEKGSKIENLEAKEKVEIKGQGIISKAEIKSEGVTIENRPEYVKVDDKVDAVEVENDKMDSKNDDYKEKKKHNNNKDTREPEWATGYPFAQMKTNELEIKIVTKLNEKSTVYYAVYEDVSEEDMMFTVNELILSGNSYKSEADTVVEEVYNRGLESGKTYNIYLTAVDDNKNKQSSTKKIKVSEIDTTAPIFTEKGARLGDSTQEIKLTVAINEIGTIYYIVVEEGNEQPTVKEVKEGKNYKNIAILASGNKKSLTDEVISGLTEGKKYDIYLVAEDESGNISDTVSKINIEITTQFGSGTESDPYKIYTIEDLASIGRIHPGTNKEWKLDKHYILMNDLNFDKDTNYDDPTTTHFNDINDDGVVEGLKQEVTTGEGWNPAEGLSGSFSGNGFTISSLYINRKSNNQGLFSKVESGAVVEKLGIIESSIKGIDKVGAIAGENMGHITDSYASASVTGAVYNMSVEVQAARIASFDKLYTSIARQPELKDELIEVSKELAGELGDASSPEVQAARLASFGELYESIARRPELKEELIEVAKELTGEEGDISSPEVQAARLASFGNLYESIARRPELKEELIEVAKELTGETGDISSPEVQAARLASFGKLYEAIARQPEYKDELIEVAKELTGETGDISSPEVQAARLASFGNLYESIARQPGLKDELIEVAKELTGETGDISSPEVQAARLASFGNLYEAIARQPELKEELIEVAKELAGETGDISSPEAQAARLASFGKLYEAIARQPEYKDKLIEVAKELAGEAGDISSPEAQAARLASFGKLYEAIARQPEYKDKLIEVAKELAGELGDASSPEVQAARLASFGKLYEAIARQPEYKDELIEVAKELTGEAGDISSPEVQAARLASFGELYISIARQPELKDELIEVAKELAGELGDASSPEVQAARLASFGKLYESIARRPELKDELIEVAKELTGELLPKVRVGGLVGVNNGTISSSYAKGDLIGGWYVGGIAGYNDGRITDSYAVNSRLILVRGNKENVEFGRITGCNEGVLKDNYANKDMEASFTGAFNLKDKTPIGKNGGNLASWNIDGNGNITVVLEN